MFSKFSAAFLICAFSVLMPMSAMDMATCSAEIFLLDNYCTVEAPVQDDLDSDPEIDLDSLGLNEVMEPLVEQPHSDLIEQACLERAWQAIFFDSSCLSNIDFPPLNMNSGRFATLGLDHFTAQIDDDLCSIEQELSLTDLPVSTGLESFCELSKSFLTKGKIFFRGIDVRDAEFVRRSLYMSFPKEFFLEKLSSS